MNMYRKDHVQDYTVFSPLGPEFNKTLFTNKALKIQGKIFMYTAIRP